MTTGACGGKGDIMFSQIVFIKQSFLFCRINTVCACEWFLSCMFQHMLRKLTLDVKFCIASGMGAEVIECLFVTLPPIKFASTRCIRSRRVNFEQSHGVSFSVIH